jgi:hypothetical protein
MSSSPPPPLNSGGGNVKIVKAATAAGGITDIITSSSSSSREHKEKNKGSNEQRQQRKRKSKKTDKEEEEIAVVSILGATRRSEDVIVAEDNTANRTPPRKSSSNASSAQSSSVHGSGNQHHSTPMKEKPTSRVSEPIQLLRPPSDYRDATVSAVNVLDSRFELVRNMSSVEKALIPTNSVFRVIGAIGSAGSGRSSTLTAVNTTTRTVNENWFNSKSNGLDIFVHSQRRFILVDFPPVCSPHTKKYLEPPVFATQLRDVSKLYDLQVAFTALVTCGVVFVCVTDESSVDEPIFQLVRAAVKIVKRRGWPCAHIVLVRNFVEQDQSTNVRRLQADEMTLAAAIETEAKVSVVHIPRRTFMDPESLQADRRLARLALGSFASRGVRVATPIRIIPRATETEWLTSLVYVFNETWTHPFVVAGEDARWLR